MLCSLRKKKNFTSRYESGHTLCLDSFIEVGFFLYEPKQFYSDIDVPQATTNEFAKPPYPAYHK